MSSEDLSKEQKAQRRAEQDSLENNPFEFRAPPGYSPYPIMDPDRGGWRGRGRGRGRASATVTSDYSRDGSWPQGYHSNKMPSRGGLGGQGRGGPGGLLVQTGGGGPGGLLVQSGGGGPGGLLVQSGGGGGPSLDRPFLYPMPGTSSGLALEFVGGYELAREGDSRMKFGSEVK